MNTKYLWLAALCAALSACGGGGASSNDGGGGGNTPPPETLFVPENAWSGTRPTDAESMNPEAFRQGIASGALVLIGPNRLAAQREARAKQMQDDRAYLAALPSPSPAVLALLEDAANGKAAGDVAMETGGRTVALLGLDVRLREAVQTHQRAQSTSNALLIYAQTFGLLPAAVKAQVPTPESLNGKTIEQLRDALAQIEAALSTVPNLDGTRPDLLRAPVQREQAQSISPGQGLDNDGPCSPTNYAGTLWYPLKNFVSPMKDQGNRGTCWAFAALGALESRERVQNNNPADLSEQFLVNKVREDWENDDDVEGFFPARALDLATDKNQVLPTEASWTYNASPNRVAVKQGDFRGACAPYANGAAGGTCSESSHQSRRVCTTAVFEFCAYSRVSYTGPGVSSGHTALLWSSGDRFDLNRYRLLLSQGVVLMASTPVYRGLQEAPRSPNSAAGTRGVVSNFDTTFVADDGSIQPGAAGSHAMQVVGFLSNAELGPPGSPANIPGGGYFVIKNSWGCNAGDAGYYYVPAAYIEFRFAALNVLNFDARRSDAWNTEQAMPGSLTPPSITPRPIASNDLDLRVPKDLARYFRVTHPAAKAVRVTITSDIDGVVFDGSWDTDPYSVSGTQAMFTANSRATRNFTVLARYGSTQASYDFQTQVINQAPNLALIASPVARVGEIFTVTAQATDLNEPDARVLCANTVWQVEAPDTLASATGCLQQVSFAQTGMRRVQAFTTDSDGATVSDFVTIEVQPPPPNPYPRITHADVLSREVTGAAPFRFCKDAAVSPGATIDLRQTGCTPDGTGTAPPRFTAKVDVDNPSGEPITYSWNLIATDDGTDTDLFNGPFATGSSLVTLVSPGQASPATHDCRISVEVQVPADPARNKRVTVWVGRCTYLVGKLN